MCQESLTRLTRQGRLARHNGRLMRPSLSIAVAQPLVVNGDIAGNAIRHADAVRRSGARVVVMPELSLTGYTFDAETIEVGDERLLPIIDACEETGSIALAGAPVEATGGTGRSIGVFRIGEGTVSTAYRKMWLGADEREHFSAGKEPSVIEVDGWRLGLAVCKDTSVAAHAKVTAEKGMDVYVAGVLERAGEHDEVQHRAETVSRKNNVWVAIASFAGSTGEGFDVAAGCSGVWSPDGQMVGRVGMACEEILTVTLDPGWT